MSQLPLEGRGALVTGVSRRIGIGAAIAHRLAEMGAAVFRCGWSAHDAAQPWGADLPGLEVLEADFLDPDAPAAVITEAARSLGHVDILAANHARSDHLGLMDTTVDELDAQWAVNTRATLLLVQALAAQHDGRAGGRVVMMTSGQHRWPMPGELGYVATKGALHQVTRTLAAELLDRGITVNTVNPGATDTGWATREPPARVPVWGRPEDAARVVTWLCTDDARWINGQVIDSTGWPF